MFTEFIAGITSYGKAFRTISKMRLWSYLLAPALVCVLLAGLIGTSAYALSDNLGSVLVGWYPFEWGLTAISKISNFIGAIVIGIGGLVIYKHLVIVAVSPFMSPLSQKVEEQLTGRATKNRGFQVGRAIKEIGRGLRIAFRNIFRELFLVAILMLLSFIPVVGVFFGILIFLVQAYFAGFGNLDYTLERHFSVKESVRFVKNHKGLAIGNGVVFLGLLMTGIGFLFAPPLAAVAGTLESVRKMEGQGLLQEVNEDFV